MTSAELPSFDKITHGKTPRTIQAQIWLKQPLSEIWEFHRDPQNLAKISPDFLKMSLLGVPEKIGKGSSFQIETQSKLLKPFFRWSVEYLEWIEEENYKCFVDTQKDGPFSYWKHKHEFKPATRELVLGEKSFHPKSEGTWIIDSLEFALKPQLKSFEWVAEKMITQLFVFRKRRLEKIFSRSA